MGKFTESDLASLDGKVDIAVERLNRRKSDGWHLKKEISMSLIISVLGIAGGGMVAYGDLKRDIALIQADSVTTHKEIQTLRDANAEIRDTAKDNIAHVQVAVDKINDKLDRLIEGKRR